MIVKIAEIIYPIVSFVAGVVGVGWVMGASVGYIGKSSLTFLLGQRANKKEKRNNVQKSSSTKNRKSVPTSKSTMSPINGTDGKRRNERNIRAVREDQEILRSSSSSSSVETTYTPITAIHTKIVFNEVSTRIGHKLNGVEKDARSGESIGVRRRTSHLG